MPRPLHSDLVVSGVGVTSAIGQGRAAFGSALLNGESRFGVMNRPGRQRRGETVATSYLGAEIASLSLPDSIPSEAVRTASFSTQVALATLHEAWLHANLQDVDPSRIGLIVGGCNVQQRDLALTYDRFATRFPFLRPAYASFFMDSDVVGHCTERFGIKGPSFTLGAASASGQAALIQGIAAVRSESVDVCVVIGALMDISYWECQAFRTLGAMGSDRFASDPDRACRPFDRLSDGFIYGEACGALVIERLDHAERRQIAPLAVLSGWAMAMDANRNPNSSAEGEMNVIQKALQQAAVRPGDIDYVNPHGSGSKQGDVTELTALKACGLSGAKINTTKSVTGHGLTAAGIVEVIATLVQMASSQLHPCLNLDEAIDDSFDWVGRHGEACVIKDALNLSYGFGGVNTAVCLRNPSNHR